MIGVTCVAVVDDFHMNFHMDLCLIFHFHLPTHFSLPFFSFIFSLPIYFHLSTYFCLPCHTTGGLVCKPQSASPANVPLMSVVGPSRHALALS